MKNALDLYKRPNQKNRDSNQPILPEYVEFNTLP